MKSPDENKDFAALQQMQKWQWELEEAVVVARHVFFPDWDVERQWQFLAVRKNVDPVDDACVPDKMIIEINVSDYGPLQLLDAIIHEICHAKHAGHGHRGPWLDEMRDAMTRAHDVGLMRLGTYIGEQVHNFTWMNRRRDGRAMGDPSMAPAPVTESV